MEESLENLTDQFNDIVKRAKSFVIEAWNAGDLIGRIKENKGYRAFPYNCTYQEYAKGWLSCTPGTANKFVRIREFFDSPEDIPARLLITHLDYLISHLDPYNARITMTALEGVEDVKIIEGTVREVANRCKTIEGHEGAVAKLPPDLIQEIVRSSLKNKRASKPPPKGAPLSHLWTDGLFGTEPINEMGTVALFCCIFHKIKMLPLEVDPKTQLYMEHIELIQAPFPDAVIKMRDVRGGQRVYCDYPTEFEYRSYNYYKHKHPSQSPECNLIICWEHNIKNGYDRHPPVLSLKDSLEQERLVVHWVQ